MNNYLRMNKFIAPIIILFALLGTYLVVHGFKDAGEGMIIGSAFMTGMDLFLGVLLTLSEMM